MICRSTGKNVRSTMLYCGVAAIALTFTSAASAQDAGPPAAPQQPAAGAVPTDDVGLSDIVVTAQRRSESMQKVPIAISALDSSALEKVGFVKPADVVAVVPSVQVQEVYGKFQPIFAIRGIAQSSYSANQSSPIGVYADEAYIGETFLHGSNFFDVERVEVLKGPQGTLYGKNTTGGAINLISRKPKIDDGTHGNLTLGYGNYKAVNVEGGIEGTVVPGKLAARVAGFYNDDEGYQRIVNLNRRAANTHTWGVRGTAVFEPVDDLQFVLRYTHSETDQFPNQPRTLGVIPAGPGGSLVDFSGYQRPSSLDDRDFQSNRGDQRVRIRYDLATLTSTLNLSAFDIVSVTSYHSSRKRFFIDTDGGPNSLLEQDYNSDTKAFSQDTRLVTTGDSNLKLIIGGYYGYERNAGHSTFTLYGSPLNGLIAAYTPVFGAPTANYIGSFYNQFGVVSVDQTLSHRSLAAYSELHWQAGQKVGVTAGLRYTRDKDDQSFYNISRFSGRAANGTLTGPLGSYVPGNITANTSTPVDNPTDVALTQYLSGPYNPASATPLSVVNKRLTGKITIDYKPSEQTMIYATFSRGYRSGNFNAGLNYLFKTPDQGGYARPESVNAYELGFKSELLQRRVRLNAAVFRYDYTNQQFEDVQGISSILVNAGKSRLTGIEGEVLVAPTRRLTLSLSGLYLDSKYRELTLKGLDLAGNSLISSPKWSGTAAIDYNTPLTASMDGFVHIDANYRGRQWYSAFNGIGGYQNIGQGGYALVNGRLGIQSDHGYQIAVWTKNLFNRRYVSYGINIQSALGLDYLMDGPPRTFGVEVSYKF